MILPDADIVLAMTLAGRTANEIAAELGSTASRVAVVRRELSKTGHLDRGARRRVIQDAAARRRALGHADGGEHWRLPRCLVTDEALDLLYARIGRYEDARLVHGRTRRTA